MLQCQISRPPPKKRSWEIILSWRCCDARTRALLLVAQQGEVYIHEGNVTGYLFWQCKSNMFRTRFKNIKAVLHYIQLFRKVNFQTEVYSSIAEHVLCMLKVPGSIPDNSNLKLWSSFKGSWTDGLTWCTSGKVLQQKLHLDRNSDSFSDRNESTPLAYHPSLYMAASGLSSSVGRLGLVYL